LFILSNARKPQAQVPADSTFGRYIICLPPA